MNVAMDVTPLRLTRAGTARYIRNLRERLDVEPVAFGGANRASVLARELWWYPFRLATPGRETDVLHCTTYYGPLRPRVPTVVTVHDLAVFRHPQAFPRWTRTYAPFVVPRVLRAARRVIAVSEFTAAELEDASSRSAREDPRRAERRGRDLRARRAARRRRLRPRRRDARAAKESRTRGRGRRPGRRRPPRRRARAAGAASRRPART